MAKAKQIMGGKVLRAAAAFGPTDRRRVRALASIDAGPSDRRKGAGGAGGLTRLGAGDRCRHCKVRKQCKPRRLCFPCHKDEAVRALYAPDGKFGEFGASPLGTVILPDRPAERPSPYRPGTVGKFLDLCHRYATGQELWHKHDARA